MSESRIKVWELSLLLALCISLCWGVVEMGRQTALSEKIIRLHVIAEDDSEAEQQRKMRVKEAVLELLESLVASADSANEAAELIEREREAILAAARAAADGAEVQLRFGTLGYSTRYAEGYVLPAGEYNSLRLIIGEGGGQNWWGVIFPQLGSGAAVERSEEVSLLDEDEISLIHGDEGYRVRFKILELIQQLRQWLDR